jgi:hypothetical protein
MLLQYADERLTMDMLSNPVFTIVPFAFWIGLIGFTLHTLAGGGESFAGPLRSARDALDEHLTRGDIGRDEYDDRRKGLDQITAMV